MTTTTAPAPSLAGGSAPGLNSTTTQTSTPAPGQGQGQGQNRQPMTAGRARHLANVKKYGQPLPINLIFPSSQSQTRSDKGKSPSPSASFLSNYIPSILPSSSRASPTIEFPICIGTYDHITRSVWIDDEFSKETLFCKGFFGKGSLSRSEPSWRQRRVDLLKGGDTLAAEQMREQRRLARRQFKIDRAQAMLDAAKQAEAILTAANTGAAQSGTSTPAPDHGTELQIQDEDEDEGRGGEEDVDGDRDLPSRQGATSPTPSTSTGMGAGTIDPKSLTPQTFLVRPTRPDQNRNRGRQAFRRRPAPPPVPAAAAGEASTSSASTQASVLPVQAATEQVVAAQTQQEEDEDEEEEEDLFDESLVEEMEHLQLSLEEAIFLSLGLGVLKIYDPITETYPPLGPSLFSLLLTPPPGTSLGLSPSTPTPMLPDDPVLVSYVAYHHFRSLGWVVKDGIKFCADWLLYRKGPVFSHSAFACIVIPVYEDSQDKVSSPFGDEDWYEERMSWKWINTVMRVNALVQKTVIAVYVTIPALSTFPANGKLANGALDPRKNDLGSMLRRYTVREVSFTRFGAARRRD
ncbi:hypothetical protein CI109_102618 [Kwoniella shandongensis]|uniref:tRNA-intron lyase n=1 Tax=Kwoniella shandongensis TaxID=1734106 RepID=A0A5M6BVY3_9TREE|nr:uncharacterized protein CI109_005200 [Kwoniella shandongensis]KAA5526431.1 hypothetical protein CI109_005200 [Kwoniella shandongensis]